MTALIQGAELRALLSVFVHSGGLGSGVHPSAMCVRIGAMNANVNYKIERNIHRTGILLSVIIPSHNAEKTLRRAVESVVAAAQIISENTTLSSRKAHGADAPGRQDGPEAGAEPRLSGEADAQTDVSREMEAGAQTGLEKAESGAEPLCEILVIENESEDGTAELALKLQAEHPDCLYVLHSKSGVSYARNRGLEAARGEWILFLDADDYLMEGAGEVLRDDLHFTGTDLIVHSYESGDRVVNICAQQGERFAGGDLAQVCVRMIENPTRYTSVWSKLFRRERIEYARLRFDTDLRLSEDSHFLIRYLAACRRIRMVDRLFYHYSTDNASVVRTWDGRKEEGYRNALAEVQKYLATQPEQIRAAFAGYGMMQFNLLMVREVFAAGARMTLADKIRNMKRISQEEPFATAIRGFDPGRHKGARYLPIRLLIRGFAPGAAAIYEARVLQNARKERMH